MLVSADHIVDYDLSEILGGYGRILVESFEPSGVIPAQSTFKILGKDGSMHIFMMDTFRIRMAISGKPAMEQISVRQTEI